MVHKVKVYDLPIKGTIICFWCGCTNHAIPTRFFKIDGIIGCGGCWNIVKGVTNHLGLTNELTTMREIVQIMKRAKKTLTNRTAQKLS